MSWTTCPLTGKHGFVTQHEAERALHKAQGLARRARRGGAKDIRRQESRVYQCECSRYHLTSWSAKSVDVATRGT